MLVAEISLNKITLYFVFINSVYNIYRLITLISKCTFLESYN
jgi:hypothetical protein